MAQPRIYECLILVDQDLTAEQVQGIVTDMEGYITSHGGEILRSESLGRRRLAYQVKRKNHGHYHVAYFRALGSILDELRYKFRIHEFVQKFLILQLEDKEYESIQSVTARQDSEDDYDRRDHDRDDGGYEPSRRKDHQEEAEESDD